MSGKWKMPGWMAPYRRAVIWFVKQDSGPLPGMRGRIPDQLWLHEFPARPTVG